jgi:hypothetical protein
LIAPVVFFLATTNWLFAATLSFAPSSGTYSVGDTLSVIVQTNAGGEAINALSGVVSFNANLLQVESVSKSNSILSLWVVEPTFSNIGGTVSFEGVVLNPGYSGTAGKLITIMFRVKKAGTVPLSFSSGTILANDGSGTDVLGRLGTAEFALVSKVVVPQDTAPLESDAQNTVQAPTPLNASAEAQMQPNVVVSASIPLLNGWQNANKATFNFTLPSEVTAIRLLLDENPNSSPVVLYEPPISFKEIEDLPEGTSYLHIQTKTAEGWGATTHHKIEVDTGTPTELVVKQVDRPDTNIVSLVFVLSAKDAASGIDRFEVILDGGATELFSGAEYVTYITPELQAGEHTLLVRTFDKSGNVVEKVTSFAVTQKEVVPAEDTTNSLANFVSSGTVLVKLLSIVIPSLALLGAIILYTSCHYRKYKDHVHTEVLEAKMVTKQAFTLIKADLEADILMLEEAQKKRALTKEEVKLLKNIKQNIAGAEKVITEEVEDILV